MKKVNGKRALAAALAVSMAVGLTACGGNKDAAGSNVKYYRANYQEDLPDTFCNLQNDPIVNGNVIYYGSNNKDYTKYGIYSYNLETKEEKTYFEQDNSGGNDPLAGGMSVDRYAVDSEGNVFLYVNKWEVNTEGMQDYSNATFDDVINFMVENWGYSDEDQAISDWNEYNEKSYIEQGYTLEDGSIDYARVLTEWNSWNLERTYTYNIKKLDVSGNEVFDILIGEQGSNSDVQRYVQDMEVGKDDMLYLYINEWDNNGGSDKYYIIAYDGTGKEKGKYELDNYGDGLIPLADGSIGVQAWNADYTGYVISVLDPATLQAAKEIEIGESYVERIQPVDDENFLISSNGSLYKYNVNTKKKEEYLNWIDADISSNNVRGYSMLADGRLLVTMTNYDYNTGESTSDIAIVEEIPAEEAAKIQTITLACIYTDEQLVNKVIELNKKNPQTRIHVESYYEDYGDMDYEDAMAGFVTKMASDPNNDIIYFNSMYPYADMMNFAAKGLLIDMGQFIDSDEELKREDFMESVLNACTYDEKLVGMPIGFSVRTVIGKASDVGNEPGWTFAEMKALLESKEPGTQLFYGKDRAWALQMCMNLGYNQFIDMEHATCNFDSQEFVDILEFANLFPEEFQWEEGVDETELMNSGKVLLADYSISDFQQIQMYTEIFGDKLTYIGYPTTEGNGALLGVGSSFSITKNCKDTDTAWKLIRQYFLPTENEGDNNLYSYGNMSIRKDDFDKFCEKAMSDDDRGSWGWGNFEVEIKPATQEQVDEVKNLIAGITAVDGSMSSEMMNIINEEAAAYFSGQKSAEEVAKIVQSRMQVYLSETN